MIDNYQQVATFQSLSWQLIWQLGRQVWTGWLGAQHSERAEAIENWFDLIIGVTADVNDDANDQVAPSKLKGPIKAGELGLNRESSSARPSGKTSFDHLA